MKGNFTRLQTHSSIFPKRYSPPWSGFLLLSNHRCKWLKQKQKQTPKTKPGEILSISSFLLELPPQARPGLHRPGCFLPWPAEAGRKLGAARSASSPAVCVRVHAHVSPAPGPGTGTALGTVSPTAQLRGLARLGEGGDPSAAAVRPAARTHPGWPALAPPPPSPPASRRTGELGYQLPPLTPTPPPARALCGNAPGGFITHRPRRRGPGSPRRDALRASLGPPCDTVGGGGAETRGPGRLAAAVGPPELPSRVPPALGRRECGGGRPGWQSLAAAVRRVERP